MSIGHLRDAGHDVASVRETSRGVSDDTVLRQAAEERRILVTFDRDFGALIFQGSGPLPAGVLFLRFEPGSPEHAGQVILDLLVVPGLELLERFPWSMANAFVSGSFGGTEQRLTARCTRRSLWLASSRARGRRSAPARGRDFVRLLGGTMRKALIVASVMSCSRLAFGETVLDHATVGLRTSDSAWSPGTGFGVVLSNRLQLPDDAVVTKFELEIGPMVTNYPLCGLELTLRWDPFHVATVAFGESCAIPITPGLLMTIAPPDRAFEYFMGLTSQRNREQSLEAAGGFNAPPQVLLHFTGSVELRAVGVAGSVGVSHQSWAATKARYR